MEGEPQAPVSAQGPKLSPILDHDNKQRAHLPQALGWAFCTAVRSASLPGASPSAEPSPTPPVPHVPLSCSARVQVLGKGRGDHTNTPMPNPPRAPLLPPDRKLRDRQQPPGGSGPARPSAPDQLWELQT